MINFEAVFFVYFLYGLTFFSMGLILLLETWRLGPAEPQTNLIRPLAIFGMMHGIHEWLEFVNTGMVEIHKPPPDYLLPLRLTLLAGSFITLWIFAIRAYRYAQGRRTVYSLVGIITLPAFAILASIDVFSAFFSNSAPLPRLIDSLVRYLLGVPGAAVASIGLHAAALKANTDRRRPLDTYLNIAAFGFALYSLTQLVVPGMNTVLAGLVNVEIFQIQTNVPIQVFRTAAAVIITTGLTLGIHFLENERQQLVTSAQKMRLETLEQKENMRRELLHHVVQAQEAERTRIARELHDEMAQTLTALSLDLATLQQTTTRQSGTHKILARMQDLGKQLSLEMQRMVHDLRPAHLDELGLVPALKYLVEHDVAGMKIIVDFRIQGERRRLEPFTETVIYRITQEALTNVARHSRAGSAEVCLCFEPHQFRLTIRDQGVGFDASQLPPLAKRWGLVGMKERAESVHGTLQIQSSPGQGTTIELSIPNYAEEGRNLEHLPLDVGG